MRIAVVQFRISHLDTNENFRRIEEFVKRAAEGDADVIVFPEDCITGSIFGDLSRLDTTGEARSLFQRIAKKFQIDIVTGSCMEGTSGGNFNTSSYIDARGEILGSYRKNHLYPSEYAFLSPGAAVPVFETAYGRAGIVICWDLLFPEIFQRMKRQDVKIVYCPSYWYHEISASAAERNPQAEAEHIDALCIVRALETNCAIVYANAAGVQTYADGSRDTLIGHSQITLPIIGAVHRLRHREEDMFIQDINLDVLKDAAHIYRDER